MSAGEGVCGRLDMTLQFNGSTYRVTVPKQIVADAPVEAGDGVRCEFDRESGELTYFLDE